MVTMVCYQSGWRCKYHKNGVVFGKASVHTSSSVKMVSADIYNYYFIYQASKFVMPVLKSNSCDSLS